jgi:hypothetical protein
MSDFNLNYNLRTDDLNKRIEDMRQELLDLLDHWYDLINIQQPRLEFLYEAVFGDLEIELEQKSRTSEELQRKVELISYKLKKGEKINKSTLEFIDMVIDREFRNNMFNRPQQNNMFEEKASSNISESDLIDDMAIEDEIPTLYRSLVKKLHPDIAGDTENFRRFWNSVQDAYKTNDITRLRLFKKTLCPDLKLEKHINEEIKLKKHIKELEININTEKRKIQRLREQEPFTLESKLGDRNWISRRRRMLRDRLFQVERKIQFNNRLITNLTTPIKQSSTLFSKSSSYFRPSYSA